MTINPQKRVLVQGLSENKRPAYMLNLVPNEDNDLADIFKKELEKILWAICEHCPLVYYYMVKHSKICIYIPFPSIHGCQTDVFVLQ